MVRNESCRVREAKRRVRSGDLMRIREVLCAVYSELEGWTPAPQTFWRVWCAFAAAIALIHATTLTISPTVWQDEVHIIEMGRAFVEHQTDWSLMWNVDRPVIAWYYLGTTLQELAFRATMPSCWGPRLLTLLGSLFASAALASWLRSKQVLAAASLLLSVFFLLEPSFVLGYRGDRLDAWVFGWTFVSCRLLARDPAAPEVRWRSLAAGACVAVAFAIWPSTVFVAPLAVTELFRTRWSRGPRAVAASSLAFAAGAAGVTMALQAVALSHHPDLYLAASKLMAGTGTVRRSVPIAFLLRGVWEIVLVALIMSPWNALLGIVVGRGVRSRIVLFVALGIAVAMLPTHVYVHRIIYLFPYFVAFLGEAFLPSTRFPLNPANGQPSRGPAWLALGVAIACAAAVSLGVRSVDALLQRDARSESRLLAAAKQVALTGEAVCVQPFELYLPGRALGWRMFTPKGLFTTDDGEPIGEDGQPPCDAAIVRPSDIRMVQRMEREGLHRAELLLEAPATKSFYPIRGYGPYAVYRRPTP